MLLGFFLKADTQHSFFRSSSSLFQICGPLQATLIPVQCKRCCLTVTRCLFLVRCWCWWWQIGSRPVSLGFRPFMTSNIRQALWKRLNSVSLRRPWQWKSGRVGVFTAAQDIARMTFFCRLKF